jgi:hypothetical protein
LGGVLRPPLLSGVGELEKLEKWRNILFENVFDLL